MSQELNEFIEDLDIYIFELQNGLIIVSEVVDVKETVLQLNYPVVTKDFKSFTPYGTAIQVALPSVLVKAHCEAVNVVKHGYFKYNLVRKIVSSGSLTEQELFEFELVLDEDPRPFSIDKKFEDNFKPFLKKQNCHLN